MTLLLWSWLLSLMGAALFFAAGGVWVRRRVGIDTPAFPEYALTRTEAAHLSERVREAAVRPAITDAEDAEIERNILSGELEQAAQQLRKLEHELRRERTERGALIERHVAERAQLEARLQSSEKESETLASRVVALTARTSDDAQLQALTLELEQARATARTHEQKLERLRKDNTSLRTVERDYVRLERERTTLREELRRTRSLSSAPPRSLVPPPASGEAGVTSSETLQSIVDSETKSGRAKSAVIADELGLVVVVSDVSFEHGEALAAFGAYLAEVGEKTRQALELGDLREVTVRDRRDAVLSIVPLQNYEMGLTLVTLGAQSKLESAPPIRNA